MAFDDCPPALEPLKIAEGRHSAKHIDTQHNKSPDATAALLSASEVIGCDTNYAVTNRPDTARITAACERTLCWLDKCVASHQRPSDQALFGIVQGGIDLDLRAWCVERVLQYDLPGYAIGGLAVGEGFDAFKTVVKHTTPLLPMDKPRYVMGVGYERDILAAVRAGVDMFDCVLPTRNGRNAYAFTSTGPLRLRNARFRDDPTAIEPGCDCPTCKGGYSRSYLRHLFLADEMLGPVLVSMHNLRHFQRYMLDIRRAITDNAWSWFENMWPVAIVADEGRIPSSHA